MNTKTDKIKLTEIIQEQQGIDKYQMIGEIVLAFLQLKPTLRIQTDWGLKSVRGIGQSIEEIVKDYKEIYKDYPEKL